MLFLVSIHTLTFRFSSFSLKSAATNSPACWLFKNVPIPDPQTRAQIPVAATAVGANQQTGRARRSWHRPVMTSHSCASAGWLGGVVSRCHSSLQSLLCRYHIAPHTACRPNDSTSQANTQNARHPTLAEPVSTERFRSAPPNR